MPTISIILAAYNAEKTIERMVDSIINQTFDDWELIAVDDGSEDGTGAILDHYAFQDNRIRVLHKTNAGVAAARQDGIDRVQGEYTIHVDADDWVDPRMLELMYKTLIDTGADIIISDYYVESNGYSKYTAQPFEEKSSTDIFYDIISGKLMGSLWNKLIRRDILQQDETYFYPGINYFEDVLFLAKILVGRQLKVIHLNSAFYHYVINEESITHNININTYKGLINYNEILKVLLPSEQRFIDYSDEFSITLFELALEKKYLSGEELRDWHDSLLPYLKKFRKGRRLLSHICYNLGFTKLARIILTL